jgi:hypothetical protein
VYVLERHGSATVDGNQVKFRNTPFRFIKETTDPNVGHKAIE